MRPEVLVVWVGVALCCALVCAQEDTEEKQLSRHPTQVREARGLIKHRRHGGQEDAEMSDDPAGAVEEEKTKPKKKKTPEEIEAGKKELLRKIKRIWSFLDLSWPLLCSLSSHTVLAAKAHRRN